jgi:hypothetical protein
MKKHYFFIFLFFPVLLIAQIIPITSTELLDLSVYGEATTYPGEGEYKIFLSADNILDKPIILVDGFDPGDTRDITGLYSLLDYTESSGNQNLADLVREEGFDVVVLNFPTYTREIDAITVDGGADFMERNAMVLVELIKTINAEKGANSPEQNVIIGPSMGGIIARFALNYMENMSIDADTRLYISFDSPHHGANVPIGLQHQLNWLAFNNTNPVAEVEPLINGLLKSPAARQLLTDHLDAHLSGVDLVTFDPLLTLPQAHPFRGFFEANINSLTPSGFPQNIRNVAIINGSGISNPYFAIGNSGPTVDNEYPVMDTNFNVPVSIFTANIGLAINLTPAAGNTNPVSSISIQLFGAEIDGSVAESQSFSYSDGIDAAPGGLFDLAGLTSDLGASGIAGDFINALTIDKFSFVPTVSALALEITDNEIDWHHTIDLAGRATTNSTPFDNTFLPDDNEPHVQLNEDNVAFVLSEILTTTLNIYDNNLFAFRLEKNPIQKDLVLLNDTIINGALISLVDITGKLIFSSRQTLAKRTVFTVNLNSGLHILNISTENGQTYNLKVIAN